MQINFPKAAIVAVSEPIAIKGTFEHPKGRTMYNITIVVPEGAEASDRIENVSYGMSIYVDAPQAQCPVAVGQYVSITAIMYGRWNKTIRQTENLMQVTGINLI